MKMIFEIKIFAAQPQANLSTGISNLFKSIAGDQIFIFQFLIPE